MDITITDNAYRVAARQRIVKARDAATAAGFTCNGQQYDSDPTSIQRINAAVTLAMLALQNSQPFTMDWTLADNTVTTLDAPGMIAVGTACGQFVAALFDKARSLQDQIAAATTADQMDAIVWTA